ncbi:MAG: hypothetical protein LBE36_02875 [Flavobacteriaceae bacterium]|jgi:hypothetical protein|nr:hypothetical protein [Flavobacteriaceae bacterium]
MKKIILSVTLLVATQMYSQCNIVGKNAISVSDTETYTIESDNAQCPDCHLWTMIGGNARIDGEFRKNSVKITPTGGGRVVLSLSVLSSQGFSQCNKNIDIIGGGNVANNSGYSTNYGNTSVDCDVSVTDFKEVKYSDGIISYFPVPAGNDFKYNWTAIYFNGEQRESSEKIPQFPYTKENGIRILKVKITSSKCMKSMSKNYEPMFWVNF